jgi:mycoredoxin-dependent peroxiredoxin
MSPQTVVGPGDEAPDFELRDQHGQMVRLSGFRGRQDVVLVFYPWAFSSVCGGELNDLQEHLSDFQNDEVALLAVSTDSIYALRTYADGQGFTFPMLADFWPHGAVAADYGVLHPGIGVAQRGTFLIDKDGIVRWTVTNEIGTARNLDDYRAALAAL